MQQFNNEGETGNSSNKEKNELICYPSESSLPTGGSGRLHLLVTPPGQCTGGCVLPPSTQAAPRPESNTLSLTPPRGQRTPEHFGTFRWTFQHSTRGLTPYSNKASRKRASPSSQAQSSPQREQTCTPCPCQSSRASKAGVTQVCATPPERADRAASTKTERRPPHTTRRGQSTHLSPRCVWLTCCGGRAGSLWTKQGEPWIHRAHIARD